MKDADLLEYIGIPLRVRKILSEIEIDVPEDDLNRSLFLYGNVGTGKTVQAAAILATACFKKINIPFTRDCLDHTSDSYIGDDRAPFFSKHYIFARVPEMLSRIKRSFERASEEKEGDLIDRYSQARLLVLDDLGSEMTTDWVYHTIYLIVDNRYNDLLPTIFTSNHSLKTLSQQLNDERLISRILEMCDEDGIREIKGDDLRLARK